MTNPTPAGEPSDAPSVDDAEHRLLAAQVEIIMAAQPLDLAAQMLAAAVAASEKALKALPDEASSAEIREAWASSSLLLRLAARPLVRQTASMNKFASQLRLAADLRFHPQD